MKQHMNELERKRLLELAREYRSKGYEVIIEPGTKQLPDFLAPSSPNMIAWNKEETVVFAVKSQSTLTASPELHDIAQAIYGRRGWRFELVVTNSRERGSILTATDEVLNDAEIKNKLQEAQLLSEQEFGEAAFVIAWSAAEAVMRNIAEKERIAKEKVSFASLSKNLYVQGVLDKPQYDVLTEASRVRNSIIHGYKEPGSLSSIFEKVVSITYELLTQSATA